MAIFSSGMKIFKIAFQHVVDNSCIWEWTPYKAFHVPWCIIYDGAEASLFKVATDIIDQSHMSHNAPVPYLLIHHSRDWWDLVYCFDMLMLKKLNYKMEISFHVQLDWVSSPSCLFKKGWISCNCIRHRSLQSFLELYYGLCFLYTVFN